MAGFYLTCVVFALGVLGVLLRIVSGLSIFSAAALSSPRVFR